MNDEKFSNIIFVEVMMKKEGKMMLFHSHHQNFHYICTMQIKYCFLYE